VVKKLWWKVSCPPSLSEHLLVCNFCFGLHLDPFQYDPKKDLACVWVKSNCCVICALFKITFLGKWDEYGERPLLLWPQTSFPDTTHILQGILSSTVSPPALNSSAGTSSGPMALQHDVWWMAWSTSERSGRGSCSQHSCSIPFPS